MVAEVAINAHKCIEIVFNDEANADNDIVVIDDDRFTDERTTVYVCALRIWLTNQHHLGSVTMPMAIAATRNRYINERC